MKAMWFLLAAALYGVAALAQKHGPTVMDSLATQLNFAREDTQTVTLLNALSFGSLYTDPDTAMHFAKRAMTVAQTIGWQKGMATAQRMCGNAHTVLGEYDAALVCFNKALELSEAINDRHGVASNVGNIATVYHNKGFFALALDRWMRALADFESLGDTFHMAIQLSNIGRVYDVQNKPDEALTNYHKAIHLYRLTRNADGEAETLTNIANAYAAKGEYEKALRFAEDAVGKNKALANHFGVANGYRSIGQTHYLQKKFADCIHPWYEALSLYTAMDMRREMAGTMANIAGAYIGMRETPLDKLPDSLRNKPALIQRAVAMLHAAAKINDDLGDKYTDAIVYEGLHLAYRSLGDAAKALEYHERYTAVKDTIFSEENNARIEALGKQREEDLKQQEIEIQKAQLKAKTREQYFYLAGLLAFLVFSVVLVYQYRNVIRERGLSDKLLRNILPHHTANELKEHGHSEARHYDNVSVLFTDFVEFSKMTRKLPAKELVELIDVYYKGFDKIVTSRGLEKIKTIGDSYMAACGVPVEHSDHALRTVEAAMEIVKFVDREARWRHSAGKPFFHLRVGINSGSVVAGIVGDAKFAFDIWGEAVNLAARMEQNGVPGKVNISGTTHALIKGKFECQHRGKIPVKHGAEVDMYFVEVPAVVEAML